MDGAQSVNIPLDSELDINSHDMLVPVDSPLFLHNRQKFSGRCLPSSVRFEHDGWAAGNYVYDFDIDSHTVNSTPDGYVISYSTLNNAGPVYLLTFKDNDGHIVGSATIIRDSNAGDLAMRDDDNNTSVYITGELNNKKLSLVFDTIARNVMAAADHNQDLAFTFTVATSGLLTITMKDNTERLAVDVDALYYPGDVTIDGKQQVLLLSFTDGMYTWSDDKFRYIYDVIASYFDVQPIDDLPVDIDKCISRVDDNTLEAECSLYVTDNIRLSTESRQHIFYLYFSTATYSYMPTVQTTDDATRAYTEWTATTVGVQGDKNYPSSNYLCYNAPDDKQDQLIELQVPVWGSITKLDDYNFEYIDDGKFDPLSIDIYHNTNNGYKRVGGATIIDAQSRMAGTYINMFNVGASIEYNVNGNIVRSYDDYAALQGMTVGSWRVICRSPYSGAEDIVLAGTVNIPKKALYDYHRRTGANTVGFYIAVYFVNGYYTASDGTTISIIYEGNSTLTVTGLDKLLSAESITVVPTHPFFNGCTVTFEGEKVTSVDMPSDVMFVGTHLDYVYDVNGDGKVNDSDRYNGDKIPSNVVSICRKCMASMLVQLTGTTSDVQKLSTSFVRSSISVVPGPTRDGYIYLDRGEDAMFSFVPDITVQGDDISIVCKLLPDNSDVLYAFNGSAAIRVPCIDADGLERYGVVKAMVQDVCSVKFTAKVNGGTNVHSLRRVTAVATLPILGIDSIDALYADVHDITFNVAEYEGKFVFKNDEHRAGDVQFSQPITISLPDGSKVDAVYNGDLSSVDWIPDLAITVDGTTVTYTPEITTTDINLNSYTKHTVTLTAPLARSTDDAFTVDSVNGNVLVATGTINGKAAELTYSNGAATLTVDASDIAIPAGAVRVKDDGGIALSVDVVPEYIYTMYPRQVIRSTGLNVTGLSNRVLIADIDGSSYTVDISDTGLFDKRIQSTFTYTSVDVHDRDATITPICTMATDDELQFVRQAWDTMSSTEQFWWIDDSTYVRLTSTELIRMKKLDSLHDWHGNNWEVDKVWDRFSVIPLHAVQYLCSSAYDTYAMLISLSVDNSTRATIHIYDMLTDKPNMLDITLALVHVPIGNDLNSTNTGNGSIAIYSYDNIDMYNLCSKAVISATHIDDVVIIGLKYNNNFNQWAIIVNIKTGACTQIQGYGCVGVDGSLTGGEIPSICFSVSAGGFNTKVQSLDVLTNKDEVSSNVADVSASRNIVVGDSTQQWYLYNTVNSIVSHILYDHGTFVPVYLPITNMYTALYKSGSTSGYNYEAMSIKRTNGNDVGASSAWNNLLSFLSGPGIYYSNPVTMAVAYLQQTLVQAAYVHYNSTSIHKSVDVATNSESAERNPTTEVSLTNKLNPLDSDTLSFDVTTITQQCGVPAGSAASNKVQLFLSMLTSSVDSFISSALQVNDVVNMSTSQDTAKQYSQMYALNTTSAIVSGIHTRSVDPGLVSQVTAVKSLDMYYSTSDGQKVNAGPGFVNHMFVAQCTAQSVTSIQYESYMRSLTTLYPGLSMLDCIPGLMLARGAAIAAEAALTANTASSAIGAMTAVSSPGYFVALAAAGIFSPLAITAETYIENMNAYMETINAMAAKGPQSTLLGQASSHQYNIEGSHKYGSRSEQFMWPCFSCPDTTVPDETVSCGALVTDVKLPYEYNATLNLGPGIKSNNISNVTDSLNTSLKGGNTTLKYFTGMIKGITNMRKLPEDMACVIGTSDFLSKTLFKNENIGESEPSFPVPIIHDYIIDKRWLLGLTSPGYGGVSWVSCKDTKVIDGMYSNIVVSDTFCGVASAYAAIEIKRGIDNRYVRPWAVTPQALLFNHTGLNCCYDNEVLHACDGYGYRFTKWIGGPGMHKEHMSLVYSYIQNERFKTSNKLPPNQLLGNFSAEPVPVISTSGGHDKVFTLLTQPNLGKGTEAGRIGEDKDLIRYSIPIFTEQVALLPAAVKTYAGYTLSVTEGITGLVTDLRTDMHGYKVPISEDFTLSDVLYRITDEYICKVTNQNGVSTMDKVVPVIGLRFLGATPHDAFFYSQDTRQYYVYSGGDRINAIDTTERFRDIVHGLYDFINQEVVVPALATFNRLDKYVYDDVDETDNVIVPRLKQQRFIGEVWPPLNTIYNTRSWYRLLSLPTGIVYQGPNRCIINQFLVSEYMVPGIVRNKGKWQRVPREIYNPIRKYRTVYDTVDVQIGDDSMVRGWTHNPFLLVTAPLGVNQETDCMFEWVVTFCWTVEMDKIIGPNEYVCVNLTSETMSPGGKKVAERPTHIFLCKELFTRSDNYGYYSFRFSGQTGAGNRERLHIWSDGFIAVSSVQLDYKQITTRRNEILTQQVDVLGRLVEM